MYICVCDECGRVQHALHALATAGPVAVVEVKALALQDEGAHAILLLLAILLIDVVTETIPGLWRRCGGLVKALLHAFACALHSRGQLRRSLKCCSA